MTRWHWLLWAALAASAISSVAPVQAQEEPPQPREGNGNEGPVSIEDIPAPARDSILRMAAGGTVSEVHEETWGGEIVYEAHVRQGRRDVIIWVDPAGKVLHMH